MTMAALYSLIMGEGERWQIYKTNVHAFKTLRQFPLATFVMLDWRRCLEDTGEMNCGNSIEAGFPDLAKIVFAVKVPER